MEVLGLQGLEVARDSRREGLRSGKQGQGRNSCCFLVASQ